MLVRCTLPVMLHKYETYLLRANAVQAGGTESCITPLALAGFGRMRALSTSFEDHPHRASRPFDLSRDGFVLGEGAAVLVLESLEHATRRGAVAYAEVCSAGQSGMKVHRRVPLCLGRDVQR